MAFNDVVFPYFPMKHNIQKTVIDPVSIVSNGNREYRIKRQAWERFSWTLPVQTMTDEQKGLIKSFLLDRSHSLNSFKFIDPDAATWNNAKLEAQGGDVFALYAPREDGNQNFESGTHPLFNSSDVKVTVDTVPDPATYFKNVVNGIPIITVPGAEFKTVRVVEGTPYYTVRLASTVSYALAALDVDNETLGVQHAAIELIEVFGEY